MSCCSRGLSVASASLIMRAFSSYMTMTMRGCSTFSRPSARSASKLPRCAPTRKPPLPVRRTASTTVLAVAVDLEARQVVAQQVGAVHHHGREVAGSAGTPGAARAAAPARGRGTAAMPPAPARSRAGSTAPSGTAASGRPGAAAPAVRRRAMRTVEQVAALLAGLPVHGRFPRPCVAGRRRGCGREAAGCHPGRAAGDREGDVAARQQFDREASSRARPARGTSPP